MTELLSLPALVALVIVALAFDFLNGLHDTANSIATIVSTRMLQPRYAVIWAAFFNFVAFLVFGIHVARTVGVGIISPDVIDPLVIFGALLGAISWNLLTWWLGIPSSSSHALIGGLLGAGVAKAGIGSIVWSGVLTTGTFIVLSPAFGFFLALLLVLAVSWAFLRTSPRAVEGVFQWLQFAAASAISLGHGGNDAQKTMGIIAVLLFSQGKLDGDFYVPFWVVITCQAAIALGTLIGGWRIVRTVGSRITRLTTVQGCCASTAGAVMLFAATYLGIPVSTTHTVTGSVIGVGAARKLSAVRWSVASNIVVAWIVTLPASAVMAATFYLAAVLIVPVVGLIGHVLFVGLMSFISFSLLITLFSSVIGIAIWLFGKFAR
jgi:inorganic phosphate transporter, PiT family